MKVVDAADVRGYFVTLAEMRTEHSRLLRDIPPDGPTEAQLERVQRFLARGTATGRLLDSPEERDVAQGLLDYWTATLYTAGRQRPSRETRTETRAAPQVPTALLSDFDTQTVRGVADQADAALAQLTPDDADVARRVLLRLVRLGPRGSAFDSVAVPRAELDALADTKRVGRVLDTLTAAGVVRTTDDGHLELAYEALTRSWPRLAAWLERRVRFRDAAEFWDKHGRDRGALLGSNLVAEAVGYRDLNGLEQEFILASSTEADRASLWRKWALVVVSALLVVAVALAVLLYFAHQRAVQKTEAAETAHADEVAARKREKAARDQAEQALAAETKARQEETKARQDADAAALKAESDRKQALNYQRQAERSQAELMDFIQQILREKAAANLLPPKLLEQYQQRLNAMVDQEQRMTTWRRRVRPVHPGASIGLASEETGGSVCCAVRDVAGRRYLLTARYAVQGPVGTPVIQPMLPDGGRPQEDRVGTLASVTGGTAFGTGAAALVELDKDTMATNDIPKLGPIAGIAAEVSPGTKVVLCGRGSGMRRGQVLRVEPNGDIVTERISSVGDGGAPVLTEDRKLIGLLWAGRNNESVVIPIRRIFDALRVELQAPERPNP